MQQPKFISLLVLASFFLFCFFNAEAQQQQYPTDGNERWIYGKGEPLWFADGISKEDIAEVTARWHRMDKEDSARNEWVGIYGVYGETHRTLLKWSPTNGYVQLSINSCAATIMRVQYGDAQLIGEQIFFYPKKSAGMSHADTGDGGEAMATQNPAPYELIPAKWRGVKYLLAESEVGLFCDYIAGYGNYNYNPFDGDAFFRSGRETGAPDELPVLPKIFEHLIKKPISGKIISVGRRKISKIQSETDGEPDLMSETQVIINIGRADNVREGMSFHILNETECCIPDTVDVTEVREKTSIGIIRRDIEDQPQIPLARRKDAEGYAPLRNGWKITTSPHVFREHQQAQESQRNGSGEQQ